MALITTSGKILDTLVPLATVALNSRGWGTSISINAKYPPIESSIIQTKVASRGYGISYRAISKIVGQSNNAIYLKLATRGYGVQTGVKSRIMLNYNAQVLALANFYWK